MLQVEPGLAWRLYIKNSFIEVTLDLPLYSP